MDKIGSFSEELSGGALIDCFLQQGQISPDFTCMSKQHLANTDKGSPTVRKSLFIWALPVWGRGSKPLPGWFVAPIFRRNVHVQTGICMILPENRCHRVPV